MRCVWRADCKLHVDSGFSGAGACPFRVVSKGKLYVLRAALLSVLNRVHPQPSQRAVPALAPATASLVVTSSPQPSSSLLNVHTQGLCSSEACSSFPLT